MLKKLVVLPLLLYVAETAIMMDTTCVESSPVLLNYMSNLLKSYKNFEKIVYVDNTTRHYVDSYVRRFGRTSVLYTMINLDYPLSAKSLRPKMSNCLHGILLSNYSNSESYAKIAINVNRNDVLIFQAICTPSDAISSYLEDMVLFRRANRILMMSFQEGVINLYEFCFYCGKSNHTLFLETSLDGKSRLPPIRIAHREFKRFHNYCFKVGYVDYFPNVYGEKGRPFGHDLNLLNWLSNKMKFKYNITREPSNSYVTLFRRLEQGHFDFLIGGLTLSEIALKKFQFTRVIKIEKVVYMFKKKINRGPDIFKFLVPFSPVMWCGIFASPFLVALVLALCRKKQITFTLTVAELLKCLLEQPLSLKSPISMGSGRQILSAWFLFTMLMAISYKSRLSSLLIKPPPVYMESLEDLKDQGYTVLVNSYSGVKALDILDSYETLDICSAINYISTYKSVLVGERSRLVVHSSFSCPGHLSARHHFQVSPEPLTIFGQGWAFDLNAPFVSAFNNEITTILNSGLLVYEQKMSEHLGQLMTSKLTNKHENINKVAKVNAYISQFALYLVGMTVAFVLFLGELVTHYGRKKCK